MKFYAKYAKALEKHGCRVDTTGNVWDARGNHAACEDRFGNVYANDPNITEICVKAQLEMDKPKPKPKPKPKKKAEPIEDGD